MVSKVNIGIVGFGIVGQALANGFKDHDIIFYDKFKNSSSLEDVIKSSEFIFICLPTPVHQDGGMDLSIIEEAAKKIDLLTSATNKIITIKSSVVPGTTRRLSKLYPKSLFAFNPEFLTEANFLEDFVNADRTIIGADNDQISLRLVSLYKNQFPKTPIFQTDLTTAEMVKFTSNTYLATKVIFANEIYDLCQKVGIKYEEVKKMVVSDRRITDSHLDVTTLRGFGGKCLPKDTASLIALGNSLDCDMSLLEAVWDKNLKIRKIHDWNEIPFAVSHANTKPKKELIK